MTINAENILDSRDIQDRIEVLETLGFVDELDEFEQEELGLLLKLREDCNYYSSDWNYGLTLIHDYYFKEYARDFAEDIHGEISGWPFDCIDWNEAADDLKMDYTEIDFDGQPYWVR